MESVGGKLTENYDGLDRLTSEISPQGSVSYQYDAASRRTQMTVAGQAAVNYGYDNADRLLSITQGGSNVAISYDNANRRTTLTLPNGIKLTYGYDNANELLGLTYTLSGNQVGRAWSETAPLSCVCSTMQRVDRVLWIILEYIE